MSETKTVERRYRVCISKGCNRCPVGCRDVPESCEWLLKHVLETKPEHIVISKVRRSGKTTAIIRQAMKAVEAGCDAIVLVRNADQVYDLQRKLMGTGVEILRAGDIETVRRALAVRRPAMVFSDEVGEWVARQVDIFHSHAFVIGYRTP